MKMNRLYTIGLPALLLSAALSACSGNATAPPAPTPASNSGTADPAAATEETGNTGGEQAGESGMDVQQENSEAASTDRPQQRSTEMLIKGEPSKHNAALTEGEGYSLYVYEEMQLQNNRLSLKSNPQYYAEIEPLPADFNLDQLRKQGKQELSKTGEVQEFSGDTVGEPLTGAQLFLQSGNEQLLQSYVVWEPKGETGYIFHIHQPRGGEGGLFNPLAYDSLASIQAK
ncbi:hypothetical protein [Paenibacillus wulumuqiensis]|uniref:hypothetical protein n=1 Tax=Paenibacillus wulumuqiensis TaxID=1567107 RepID=UPI00069810D8|nr:hypothetical protein [Paenibacillus wulumuqiensis]